MQIRRCRDLFAAFCLVYPPPLAPIMNNFRICRIDTKKSPQNNFKLATVKSQLRQNNTRKYQTVAIVRKHPGRPDYP